MLNVSRDYLILEVNKTHMNYMYVGVDHIVKEFLDQGEIEFHNDSATGLYNSIDSALKELRKKVLPGNSHLDVYLIPLLEMVQTMDLIYPQNLDNTEWRYWELSQVSGQEISDQLAEFIPNIFNNYTDLIMTASASVSNKFIDSFCSLFEKYNLYIAGILLPQIVWKNALDQLHTDSDDILIIYENQGEYCLIDYLKNGFPKINIYGKAADDSSSLLHLCNDLTTLLKIHEHEKDYPVYFLRNNIDADKIDMLKKNTGAELREVNLVPNNNIESENNRKNLTLLLAQKVINGKYILDDEKLQVAGD